MFKNKIAVVTGGAQGIGRAIVDAFTEQGASVCVIDKKPIDYFVGDPTDESILRQFAAKVVADY